MKRTVQIYVENVLLDLFDDEQIVVNSSVQNISDISKVFTDFSQSFTIPCSPVNNQVFEHYYNNDVDNTIDHNLRREARIEIDHSPFRTGKIQIEKAQIKDGESNSYMVTFYGDIVTLKDLIGEDKLSDLDYSDIDHTYSGAEVQSRIESAYDIDTDFLFYPLISSGRVWQHGDSTTNDISIVGGAISYTELFPAVSVLSIFRYIGIKYGVSFTGSFLNDNRFKKLFLWFKNKENFTYYSQPKALRFAIGDPATNFLYESTVQQFSVPASSLITGIYDIATGIQHSCTVEISTGSSVDYFLDIYKDGAYYLSQQGNGTQTFNIFTNAQNYGFNNAVWNFQLRSVSSITFSCTVNYDLTYTLVDVGGSTSITQTDSYSETSATSFTTVANTNIGLLAPEMKITDFMSGVFNMFYLTCYGTNTNEFRIEPLETFYATGREYDITEFVVLDDIQIDRPKLYNKISFEYEQSQSFMNREFFDLFKRDYGNLESLFGYDGGDFTIKVPFEILLHNKFTGTNIQVGYSLGTEPEYKNYIPKPVMLYIGDHVSVGGGTQIKFDNGSSVVDITNYVPFGQDATNTGDYYSINWGSEVSSFYLNLIDKSLYREYYEPYLTNLYNGKTRIVTVKTILPLSMLVGLKLNDKLLIRDKKYIINDMKSNLTTGEVELVLLSDWREYEQDLVFNITSDATDIDIPITVPDRTTYTIEPVIGSGFTTPSTSSPSGTTTVTISATQNLTASPRVDVYPVSVEIQYKDFTPNKRTFYITINQSA